MHTRISSGDGTNSRKTGFSAVIAGLERQLGRLHPRPEAPFQLEEADAVLERLTQTGRTMAEIGRLARGRFKIACRPAASSVFLPRLLTGYLKDHPEVDAALIMRSSPVLDDLVASQDYDLGLAETPARRASVRRQDFEPDCMLALPADHPLGARQILGPLDLAGVPMALLHEVHPLSDATSTAFAAAAARLRRRFVLRRFLPAMELVRQGLCVCLCDAITAWSTLPDGPVFRPFRPPVRAALSILTPSHRPPSLVGAVFRDRLEAALRDLSDSRPPPPALH